MSKERTETKRQDGKEAKRENKYCDKGTDYSTIMPQNHILARYKERIETERQDGKEADTEIDTYCDKGTETIIPHNYILTMYKERAETENQDGKEAERQILRQRYSDCKWRLTKTENKNMYIHTQNGKKETRQENQKKAFYVFAQGLSEKKQILSPSL